MAGARFILLFALVASHAIAAAIVGTVSAVAPPRVTVQPDAGAAVEFAIENDTLLQRIAPGEKDLRNATPITAADIAKGDRVLVNLVPDAPVARRVVVMSSKDIQSRNDAARTDWTKRGIAGLVASKSGSEIRLRMRTMAGEQSLVVAVNDKTVFRRYAPDSIRFADAVRSSVNDIQPGDQLRARGAKSADGLRVDAEEVVFGTFLTKAGTVTAIDAAAGEITMQDLATKKPLVVKLGADTRVKKMPDFSKMAGAGMPGPSPPGGRPGPPAGFRPPDWAQMLERMPAATLDDFKAGQMIVVSSTKGARADRLTAIMLLANAEMLVQMASMQAGGMPMSPGAGMGMSMPGISGGGGLDIPSMIP